MENTIRITKVPNPEIKPISQDSRDLPKMPTLYLELIENKDKIKQGLVNKEYDPDDAASDITYFGGVKEKRSNALPGIDEEEEESVLSQSIDDDSVSLGSDDTVEKRPTNNNNIIKENVVADDDTDVETSDSGSGNGDDDSSSLSSHNSQPAVQQQPKAKTQQYAKILNESLPPKLSDLERQGEIRNNTTMPNLDRMYATEDEEDEMKRELLFKFELLKKAYKTDIPDFNVHSDLKQMSRSYESTLRRVSLDSCVDNYKQLLIGGFMVLEFILGYLFKFDMQGFTQQQILNMNQYERLLIELGEQSYVPGGTQWPVEVRLLLMVMGNAAIFVIAKMIMKKTGSNIMSAMNTYSRPQPSPLHKRKMRGPTIQPDDIPDISSEDF